MFGRVWAVISAFAIVVVVALIVVLIFGPRRSASIPSNASQPAQNPAATAENRAPSPSPEGHTPAPTLDCIAERIRDAPAPFHWSYKRSTSGGEAADWEADISSDAIHGNLVDGSGTFPIDALRRDVSSWKTAVSVLTAPLPVSAFALLQNSPAPRPAAVEKLDGEYTVKYVIDTSRGRGTTASSNGKASRPRDLVKGAVWLNRDGCPLKFVLEVEQSLPGGITKKAHYEGEVKPR